MNIAVLDDMPEDLNRLCRLLESVCAEHTPRPVIRAFTDDKKFLAHMSAARADIVFLDIYLGERTGAARCHADVPFLSPQSAGQYGRDPSTDA